MGKNLRLIEKCFVKEILDLPDISGADPHKIKEFCPLSSSTRDDGEA